MDRESKQALFSEFESKQVPLLHPEMTFFDEHFVFDLNLDSVKRKLCNFD